MASGADGHRRLRAHHRPPRFWWAARLSTKLILFSILLTALLLAALFIALNVAMRANTRALLADTMSYTQGMLLRQEMRNHRQLLWASSLITQNPTLRAAIETYRLEAADAGLRDDLLVTIDNEVRKIAAGLERDLLIITDENGHVLSAREAHGTPPAPGADLSMVPLVRGALLLDGTETANNFNAIRLGEDYYLAGSVPIVLQGYSIGTLTLGDRIDGAFVAELQNSFGGDAVVAVGSRVRESTLPGLRPGAPIFALLDREGPRDGQPTGRVALGEEEFVVAELELSTASTPDVTVYLLHSLTDLLADSTQALRRTLAYHALAAILLGALGAWAMARSSLRRLERFTRAMRGVALTGDYSRRVIVDGKEPRFSHELQELHEAFDEMLAQIQSRETELHRQIQERQRTERTLLETEEQLQQSQKLESLGQLAGGVAHDFNNLLTVINGYSDMVMQRMDPADPLRDRVAEIRKAGDRAGDLTRHLLAFSRKQVLEPKVIQLNQIVNNLKKMLGRLIGEDVQLETSLDPSLGLIKADPGQIEQVILNLSVNARDAMSEGGRLLLETRTGEDGRIVLRVTDTGCGMDRKTQQRAFEPFFTTKPHGKGTGLGLAMVYGIVQQSDGRISLDSMPGKGTSVTLTFPSVRDRRATSARQPDDAAPLPSGGETLLLVEDEEPVRRLARSILEQGGYKVLEARHGRHALDVCREFAGAIDLMVTDVVMPHMNGYEAARQLARSRPEMKVLFTSGYPDHVLVKDDGTMAPDIAFLHKPFTSAHLARKVRAVLDGTSDN